MTAYGEKNEGQLRIHQIIVQLMRVYHSIYNHRRALTEVTQARDMMNELILDLQNGAYKSHPMHPTQGPMTTGGVGVEGRMPKAQLSDDWIPKALEKLPKTQSLAVKEKEVVKRKSFLFPSFPTSKDGAKVWTEESPSKNGAK